MAQDYFPQKDVDLKFWLQTLSETLANNGALYGLSPAEITAGQNACANLIVSIEDFFDARTNYRSKKAAKRDSKKSNARELRKIINRMKGHPGFDTDRARIMKIATHTYANPDNDYVPIFKLKNFGTYIKVSFKKRGASGVRIYSRVQGEKNFVQIDHRTRSPFIDDRPLTQPGVPEVREYKLIGTKNDEIVGQFSNMQSIVFAGQ